MLKPTLFFIAYSCFNSLFCMTMVSTTAGEETASPVSVAFGPVTRTAGILGEVR